MTINEKVDEIEQQICCHEINKEQVFTKMKYLIQQLQKTTLNKKYVPSCTGCIYSPESECTAQCNRHAYDDMYNGA